MGNVTSLGWQGSSCQPAAFSVHAGYVSCLGLKGLIGRAAYGNDLDVREGRYKALTAENTLQGMKCHQQAAQTWEKVHHLLEELWRC